MTHQVQRLPAELRRTLTWDQGKEIAENAKFSVATNVRVFFCDPHTSRSVATREQRELQRSKGLLRSFPKDRDLTDVTRAELTAVAREFDARPRQARNWMKPCEVFGRSAAAGSRPTTSLSSPMSRRSVAVFD